MLVRRIILITGILLAIYTHVHAQQDKMAYLFTGIVYDDFYRPLPYTHVLAQGTGVGDVTDSLGVFSIYIRKHDQLSFYNISYQDTSRFVTVNDQGFYIILKKRYFVLKEARVYDWGSSYGEFIDEVKKQGEFVSEGAKMGLPVQDPDYIPFNMNERLLQSAMFFFNSPLSYLYYNMNKKEKGARKAYQLEKDKELIEKFEEVLGKENISYITGLEDDKLEKFMLYLNDHMMCDYHCNEIKLLTEIHYIWKQYQGINALMLQ